MLDADITCSVANDPIVSAFRPTLVSRLKGYGTMQMNEREIKTGLYHDVDRMWRDLSDEYYTRAVDELKSIDWHSTHFNRLARQSERLLECLVSQLIHKGYSLFFLNGVASEMAEASLESFLNPLDQLATVSGDTQYLVAFNGKPSDDETHLLQALKATKWKWRDQTGKGKFFLTFAADGRDPTAAVSGALRKAFRHHHVRQNGIPSRTLEVFSQKLMWGERADGPVYQQDDRFAGDPRFVSYRSNTVARILAAGQTSIASLDDFVVQCVEDALYLYNQALFVPSLENSYTLLWTALEVMAEFKQKNTVMGNVASLVSAVAGLGAFGRRVYSLARLCEHYGLILAVGNALRPVEPSETSLSSWATAFCADSTVDGWVDPYDKLVTSPLCSFQYCRLNQQYKTWSNVQDRMRRSRSTASQQIERLYIARNAMVHGGRFDEHSEDLWIHLECYVGSLIATAIGYAISSKATGKLAVDADYGKGFWKDFGASVEAQLQQVLATNGGENCAVADWTKMGCFAWPEACL